MPKSKKKIVDLTKYKDIIDEDGYLDCESNLINAIQAALKTRDNKEKLFKILVSKVNARNENNPFRYSKEKIVTLKTLKRYCEEHLGEVFSKELIGEEIKKNTAKRDREQAFMEKEGEARAAWGLLANIGHQIKLKEENQKFEEKIKHLDSSSQERARQKRRQQPNPVTVYIG